jgi:hypothetical protein
MQRDIARPRRRTVMRTAASLCMLAALVGQAAAQQPSKAQQGAVRAACRSDFMAHCSRVNPNGAGAMACLQRHAAALSPRCRTAVAAAGGGPPPAGPPPAARPPTAPPASPPAGAQGAAAAATSSDIDVASVESISGRVLTYAHGKPGLLGRSDIIGSHTQLDLQANSELQICLYAGRRLLSLKGPLRAMVETDGVTDASGRAIAAAGTCNPPSSR